MDRRLGGPQSQSGTFEEEKISFPCRELNPNPSVVQPVGIPTDFIICTLGQTVVGDQLMEDKARRDM
jgi:hypothetical protein